MDNNGPSERITLRYLDEVEQVQALICAQMAAHRYSHRDVFSVRLALDESLNNAIRHGNRMDPSKQVRVAFCIDPEFVWIRVEDQGEGFNPADVRDPTQNDHLDQPGGRGLLVMRAFMCSVEYNDRGNCVTMCKCRSSTTATTCAAH